MSKDRFIRILLVVVAALLLANLINLWIFSGPEAAAKQIQKLAFRGNGVGIACSDSGQYVYAAGSTGIVRSTDFGKPGTWEMVVD